MVQVMAQQKVIASQVLTFALLAPLERSVNGAAGRSFGIILSPNGVDQLDLDTTYSLLQHIAAGAVKIAVWPQRSNTNERLNDSNNPTALLAWYQKLLQDGFELTAVLAGPPADLVRKAGPYPLPLLEMLTSDPAVWRDDLVQIAAPYASVFYRWQIGADDDVDMLVDPRRYPAAKNLQTEMERLVTQPRLSLPASTALDALSPSSPDGNRDLQKVGLDSVTLAITPDVHADWITPHVQRLGKQGHFRIDAYLQSLQQDRYQRLPALARWAQRVIMAKHAGVETLFIDQPWTTRRQAEETITEPKEKLILFRTIANMLAGTTPGEIIRLGKSARAVLFHRGTTSVAAFWDRYAPEGGKTYAIQLGNVDNWIDLWGRTGKIKHNSQGQHLMRLSAIPIFVQGIDRSLLEFRRSITLTPTNLSFSTEPQTRTISMTNTSQTPLRGWVELHLPKDWQANPQRFQFEIPPDAKQNTPIQLRYPTNESAGQKKIQLQIQLDGTNSPATNLASTKPPLTKPPLTKSPLMKSPLMKSSSTKPIYMIVSTELNLGLDKFDIWAVAFWEGKTLVVRQTITSRSNEAVSFRGQAQARGRPRKYRNITDVGQGQTRVIEYRYVGASSPGRTGSLSGEIIRVGLRELGGPRIHNLDVPVP